MVKTFCGTLLNRFPALNFPIPEKVMEDLSSFLQDREIAPKTILKPEGEIENTARLILEGVGAVYTLGEEGDLQLKRVFGAGDVLVDLYSYRAKEPTSKIIMAYSKLRVAELSRKSENRILTDFPIMNKFSTLVSDYLKYEDERWIELISEPHDDRLGAFITFYPGMCREMLRKDVCQLLRYKPTTLKKIRPDQF